ncbi:MAG TPA: family 43 glycosylhydrolase [Verrucomicrobia bacterium]|nr:family 43 glycosylhydrolase [Verrucomicrobiota bacterium]
MKNYSLHLITLSVGGMFLQHALATNPLITDQFTADPTARVFEGRIYVYPSHDIPHSPGKGRTNWFVMEDYHVFSSENLTDWTDHGVILNQTNVPWLTRHAYDMWAPDCVEKGGKYYFYFPAGGRIGVAIADKPYGPFTPEPTPIEGVRGIDPAVLIDKDGTGYLFWSRNALFVARLKDNMLELDSPVLTITNLPRKGLIEGPFAFERNGIYYLTYPHVQNSIERLEYATSAHPMGPYEWKGVILDESESGCWTVHHSIVEYKGQWYLFYHDRDLSPEFDKNRSIRADKLFFNEDGTIQKVIPTLRGVGIVDARSKVQIDRYSAVSPEGTTVSFLDETNRFAGWKISLKGGNSWVQFNEVDFGQGCRSVNIRSRSAAGGPVEIRLDQPDGPVLARVEIGKGSDWKVVQSGLDRVPEGVHHLVVRLPENNEVELDWVSFE